MYVSCGFAARGFQAGERDARGGAEGCYAGEAAALAIPAVTGSPNAGVRTAIIGFPPTALRGKVRFLNATNLKEYLTHFDSH